MHILRNITDKRNEITLEWVFGRYAVGPLSCGFFTTSDRPCKVLNGNFLKNFQTVPGIWGWMF